jgi:hypothetical protein
LASAQIVTPPEHHAAVSNARPDRFDDRRVEFHEQLPAVPARPSNPLHHRGERDASFRTCLGRAVDSGQLDVRRCRLERN